MVQSSSKTRVFSRGAEEQVGHTETISCSLCKMGHGNGYLCLGKAGTEAKGSILAAMEPQQAGGNQ